jgi:hypothetical protein
VPSASLVSASSPAGAPLPDRDAAARKRADRLAKATTDQIQAALAYLSIIDPEAFEIAFTAVAPALADDPDDPDAIPLCATCGAPVGIFPELIVDWRHFRGDDVAWGTHQTYDPGHGPQGRLVPPRRSPGRPLEATVPVPRRSHRRGTEF